MLVIKISSVELQLNSVKENLIQIEKKPTAMQFKGTTLPVDVEEIKLPETNSVKNVQTEWTCLDLKVDREEMEARCDVNRVLCFFKALCTKWFLEVLYNCVSSLEYARQDMSMMSLNICEDFLQIDESFG
ncbi:hypothetical protein T459_11644 [Capsicum annuum]|uniref:Uncharacterized protein n=1 Tax=Capsicum annuum TaxID=4072 RepID=A0A2G2ZMM4_CAPAN|nr:hypothetical protein T459_11644 [Capsicum annuum]